MLNSGRVLVVGGRAAPLVRRLEKQGYACDLAGRATDLSSAIQRGRPDAIVLAGAGRGARTLVRTIRSHPQLGAVPVLVDGSGAAPAALVGLDVDTVARSPGELERLLAASLRARRQVERDLLDRRRLELLLDIARATAIPGALCGLLQSAAQRLGELLGSDAVSLLQLEGAGPHTATLVDAKGCTPVDLALTPRLRRALDTREPSEVEGGWVVPIGGLQSGIAAVVVRTPRRLDQLQLDLVSGVGAALGQALERGRTARTEAAVVDELEAAYVDRYRELAEANQRLKALDGLKNELLAVLSHDLRSPLNVLLGHAHLLLNDAALDARLRPSAEAMQRTSRKLLELVKGLLEKSRSEGGRVVLYSRAFDVAETCQETVRELQILARERSIALGIEAPLSVLILGDEQKIGQVLQNLVTNALEHARKATRVTVRAQLKRRPDGDVALVEVRDDGHVANPNDLILAFDRAHGIGLSICRDYVERHGGEIWAEAPKEGGVLFAFTLPVKPEAARPPPALDVATPLVLVADCDPIFARAATMSLSGHYRVELVRDGEEAIARAHQLNPAVVVVDVFMPRRDGFAVLRALRASPHTAATPVILVSGNPDIAQKLEGLELGAVDLLVKPFPASTLLARVADALQRSHARSTAMVPGNDAETGLFDHLGLVNRLEQERSRGARTASPLSIALLRPTAPPGDRTRALAAVVRRELGTPDVVGHLGHGVLCVLMPETSAVDARPVAARLCEVLLREGLAYLSTSIEVRDDPRSGEAILEQLLS